MIPHLRWRGQQHTILHTPKITICRDGIMYKKYDGNIYNYEFKKSFLKSGSSNTRKRREGVFRSSYEFELKFEKDLCFFNLEEIESWLISQKWTETNVKSACSQLRSYIKFKIKEGVSLLYNPLNELSEGWYEKVSDGGEVTLLSKSQVDEVIESCVNEQDAVIVSLLFEGAGGFKFSELSNLKLEDVNFEEGILNLTDDKNGHRTIQVTKQTLDLISRASTQDKYFNKNGSVRGKRRQTSTLFENGYVIKPIETNRKHLKAQYNTIRDRIETVSEFNEGKEHIYPIINIIRSGQLYKIKKIIEQTGKLTNKDYERVLDDFGKDPSPTYIGYVKEVVNPESLKSVYGIEDFICEVIYTRNDQKELDKILSENKSLERNQKLVHYLKDDYGYKCQLCSDIDNMIQIPDIIDENGKRYIEVHHIIPLSKAKESLDVETERVLLDNLDNLIVVCCFHHKYLHYHEGGFEELLYDEEDELHFKSKQGTVLKVVHDKHLKKTRKNKGRSIVEQP